ncbi:molecular chaperone [Enterobacter quasiroggenkampii]|uniref:fimbrial biogenesis chaperone n=1 Tax=Enterobacter quasiroggenkampii TaxID=2497436 RepID=UPI0021D31A51|nr:molecular chaperone [Enterobacter quasiroggenkampii]MCU6400711.1 molecular chaperone [Enterobacter quasiroggenkampii]
MMKSLIIALFALYSASAISAIQIESSRVIYSGENKSASLTLHNASQKNYIIQTWLDEDSDKPGKEMVVTPPIMKVKPDQSAVLRFIYSGKGLPIDRESVYWINVQEIPPRASEPNVMQLAIRTRLKLFYRPVGMKAKLDEQIGQLTLTKNSDALVVSNPGPLHISLSQLMIKTPQGKEQKITAPMIAPFGSETIPFPKGSRVVGLTYINDYGGVADVKMH